MLYDGSDLVRTGGFSFDQQKANAVRAYFEWMPIRQSDMDDNLRIWRDFSFGDLVDLIMLDTRNYQRDITDSNGNREYLDKIRDEQGRSVLGNNQENWFFRKLRESKAKWKVVGQQINFANIYYPDRTKAPYNADAWEGYRASKNRTLATLRDNKVDNTVFLAGDSHAVYVSDLAYLGEQPYNKVTGEGALAVEFGGTAVTSPGPAGQNGTYTKGKLASELFVGNSEELQYQESFYRGYYEIFFNQKEARAEFFATPIIRQRNGKEIKLAEFRVKDKENRLARQGSDGNIAVGDVVAGSLKNGAVDEKKAKEYDTHDYVKKKKD
jgi:alkaline phosphatase D